MSGVVPSPRIADKALRLIEQHRVTLLPDRWYGAQFATVGGDSDAWTVTARQQGIHCSCPAGQNWDPVSCSHKVAAQLLWADD